MIESSIREIPNGLWRVLVHVAAERFEVVDERGITGAVNDALQSININPSIPSRNVMLMILDDMDDGKYLDIWFKDKLDATRFFLNFC
jgi:hypothetical protein